LSPDAVVLVATIRALKMHGGVARKELGPANPEAVKKGLENLGRHIRNLGQFGVPAVVAINHFDGDTSEEIELVKAYCAEYHVEAFECRHWEKGSKGIKGLAKKVAELADSGTAQFRPLYDETMSLWEKTRTIARSIYGADDVIADKKVRDQFARFEQEGFGHFQICMAKTQYSFSTDPDLRGAPINHVVPIREVSLSAGAEFLVVICGQIMTMPGLPRVPAANNIFVNEEGLIEGLF